MRYKDQMPKTSWLDAKPNDWFNLPGPCGLDRVKPSFATVLKGGPGSGRYPKGSGRDAEGEVTRITGLLNDAKTAHTAYEKSTGVPDKAWASWYAGHMAKGMGISQAQLTPVIEDAAGKFPGADWPERYAEHIVATFGTRRTLKRDFGHMLRLDKP